MNLLLKQENAVFYLKDKETKEILYGGAAGGGKSALGCLWLIEMCQEYKGSRWLMGRSKLKSLKETTLKTFFELTSKLELSDQFIFNAQQNIIYWNNGSEILLKDLFLYPSDPNFDSLGSLEICGAFIDECNQVVFKAWQIVTSRCRYKLKEFNIIPKVLGSCNPSKNWTYSEFYKPNRDGDIKKYRKFIQALPTDNPHLPISYLESLLSLDSNSKQRLYYGNWEYDDDPSALMSFNKIQDIFTNSFVKTGQYYLTGDIARFGNDSTVLIVWNGLIVEKIIRLRKFSTKLVAIEIKKLREEFKIPLNNVVVDEDGVGGGVVDQLNCIGFINNSKAKFNDNFVNLKSQCYFKLAELVNKNEIFIKYIESDIKEMLIEELEQVKRKDMDKDGKLSVIPKDKVKELIGRSPDISDSLMMRMIYELKIHNLAKPKSRLPYINREWKEPGVSLIR